MFSLLVSGAVLTITGVLIVFAFLALLVCAIGFMSRYLQRFVPPPGTAPTASATPSPPFNEIVAAISAAVQAYRQGLKK